MIEHHKPNYPYLFLCGFIAFCAYILSYREDKMAADITDIKRQETDMRIEIESNPIQYQILDLHRQIKLQDEEISSLKQDVESLKRNE